VIGTPLVSGASRFYRASWPTQKKLRLIDRQRLRPPLRQRCVALIDVVGDVGEQQRRGKRRRLGGFDGGDANVSACDLLQDIGRRAEIEQLAHALTVRLKQNRELPSVDLARSLRWGWEGFTDLVKHHNRYFLYQTAAEQASEVDSRDITEAFEVPYEPEMGVSPGRILDVLGEIVRRTELVRTLGSNEVIFRARVHESSLTPTTPDELGPPPREKARQSNRMSPAGIVMFYGALDRETVIAETYEPDRAGAEGMMMSLAQFESVRPLKVLDLTRLPLKPSFFVDRELRHGVAFLYAFEADFVKPIARDGMEHVEYVPTQVVTDYFRQRFRTESGDSIDGIVYRSSRTSAPAVVLFLDRAACGAETPFGGGQQVLSLDTAKTERFPVSAVGN